MNTQMQVSIGKDCMQKTIFDISNRLSFAHFNFEHFERNERNEGA